MARTLSLLILLAGFVFGTPHAVAQNDTREARLAAARTYLALTENDSQLQQTAEQALLPLLAQIKARQPKVYEAKHAEIKQALMGSILSSARAANANTDERMADIFTVTELKALEIFAKSRTGNAVLQKLPKLAALQAPDLQRAMLAEIPKLRDKLKALGVNALGR